MAMETKLLKALTKTLSLMKLNYPPSLASSLLAVAWLCGGDHCAAQSTSTENARDRYDVSESRCWLGPVKKASDILGIRVNDSHNQKIGKVKELAVDLGSGRLLEVIVASGGILGINERLVAVPPGQFTCDPVKRTLRLNLDKTHFRKVPTFKISPWEDSMSREQISAVYKYYGATPYFISGEVRSGSYHAVLGHLNVEQATRIIGTPVQNSQSEKLGTVKDLIVEIPAGRVVEVVVSSGGFLGMGDEYSAAPPQSFQHGVMRDQLILDTTRQTLARAPHFNPHAWPALNDPDQAHFTSVYRAYNVEPYFLTNAADNAKQHVRDRQENAPPR